MFGPGVEDAIAAYRKADDDLAGLMGLFGSTEQIVPRWKREGETVIGLAEDGREIVRVPMREPLYERVALDTQFNVQRTNCP
jgi:nitrate reductase beta subunit